MQNSSKILGVGALVAAVVASAGLAESHGMMSDNKAVAARHHQMQMIAYHTGLLGGMAKGEMEFDSATVDASAQNIAMLAQLERATLWVEGTEQGAADKSRAKAEIWSDPEGFAAKFEDLEEAGMALVGASDLDALRAGMGALGGACKACHEEYRGPKN